MPGYIIHLSEAEIVLQKMEAAGARYTERWKETYRWANLIPDAVKEKAFTHFWREDHRAHFINAPDICRFEKKYGYELRHRDNYPDIFGYYTHLYLDRMFLEHYLKARIRMWDLHGCPTDSYSEAAQVRIEGSEEEMTLRQVFSASCLYDDYTKLTPYLWQRFCPVVPETDQRSEAEELKGLTIKNVCRALRQFVKDEPLLQGGLRILEADSLDAFLDETAGAMLLYLQNTYF